MIQSFKVSNTLASQRFVSAQTASAGYVEYPPAGTVLPIGITKDTVKDVNQAIPVAGPGEIAKVQFNDTCPTGALVASNSSGQGIPFVVAQTTTSLTLPAAYGGVLIGPSVAATGTVANVYCMPGLR